MAVSSLVMGMAVLTLAGSSKGQTNEIAPPRPPDPLLVLPALPTEPLNAKAPAVSPRVGQGLVPDSTGMIPSRPPGPPAMPLLREAEERIGDLLDLVQEPEAEVNVVIGRSKLLRVRQGQALSRVAIANPNVADVRLLDDGRSLNVYGLSYGSTSLTVFDNQDQPLSFLIRVSIDALDMQGRLRQIFPGADVRIRQIGPQVILDGQVPDAKTMAEILQLVEAELRGAAVNVLGRANTQGMMGGAAPIAASPSRPTDQSVRRAVFQNDAAGSDSNPVVPAPPASGTAAIETASQTPGGFGPLEDFPVRSGGGTIPVGTIINRVKVPGPRQILLHVKIAELNRTALRQIGVNWLDTRNTAMMGSNIGNIASVGVNGASNQNAAFSSLGFLPQAVSSPIASRLLAPGFQPVASAFTGAASAANTANSQLFGVFNAGEFNLFLNALRQNDMAKLLAEPNLVTLDGQPARFLAGGSFPYPVPQTTSAGGVAITIAFRDYGAILQFLPHILAGDVIRLDVEPAFSQLNFATGTAVQGTTVPGITQRTARTVVELREGQTLAIAGLLQTATSASTMRIPILGDIPIVAPLFSRNVIQTVETELVVLVTPELVAPVEQADVPPQPG
ncbi:MAG: pilus assembly protein N-terminal domain-containing protein, partial [Isosphaeraceae bacterium]